ncbi:MAG: MBL fold metallo-hydrolase [Synergistaceae bacterium]|jgi:glyoxylase-like metal-dependent hydrolase (beta-lactamase superfamily II)|nr:MBL fold metallo-hydrolase [Synergistaceae bacterium]
MNPIDERKTTVQRGIDRRGSDGRADVQTAAEWTEEERKKSERRLLEGRVIFPEKLHLLDLPQFRPGFRQFIASWFFIDSLGRRMVVDPGPASTIPLLLRKLSFLTNDVDYVLLTHIHLDHSGGIGQFCQQYKNAKVLVHPKARRYLLDPGKLWKSSLEILGDIAVMYGTPVPLAPDSLLDRDDLSGVTILETPGHAPHHLSFIVQLASEKSEENEKSEKSEKVVFVGEAAGLFLPLGSSSALPYLRPTTPPKFDGVAARASLRKISESLRGDELLCYAHWGAARHARNQMALARGQFDDWTTLFSRMKDQTERAITNSLFEQDSLLSGYFRLPEDLRTRELFFIRNSVKGFLQYIRKTEKTSEE